MTGSPAAPPIAADSTVFRRDRSRFASGDGKRAAAGGETVDGLAYRGNGNERIAAVRTAGSRSGRQGRDVASGRIHQRLDFEDQQNGARIGSNEPWLGGSSVS